MVVDEPEFPELPEFDVDPELPEFEVEPAFVEQ